MSPALTVHRARAQLTERKYLLALYLLSDTLITASSATATLSLFSYFLRLSCCVNTLLNHIMDTSVFRTELSTRSLREAFCQRLARTLAHLKYDETGSLLQMLKLIMSSTVIRCHVCLKNLRRSVLFNSQTPDDALKSCFVLLLFTSSLRLMQTEYRRRVQRPGGWVSIHFCFTADWLRCRCCPAAGLIIRQPQTFIHTHTQTPKIGSSDAKVRSHWAF